MWSAKAKGSTWLTTYDGKLWPVVLCRDEFPPKRFMSSRSSPAALPAILLGKHIYIWVTENSLQDFDPSKDYLQYSSFPGSTQQMNGWNSKSERLRYNAFIQDALQYKDDAFWKNYIESNRAACRLDRKLSGKRRPENAWSDDDTEIVSFTDSRTPSTGPYKRRRLSNGRAGVRSAQLPTPGPTPIKTRNNQNIAIDSDAEQVDDDLSENEDSFVRQSKIKSDLFVQDSSESEDDEDSKEQQLLATREKNKKTIKDKAPKYNDLTIFVGEEHTPFSVKTDAVQHKCDFLWERKQYTDDLALHINLYEESQAKIQAKEFEPVWQYLTRREFTPRIVECDSGQKLEKVFMEEQKDDAAMKVIQIYVTASKIQFGALQLLCVNKLRVLYPLSSSTLLIVATMSEMAEKWDCDTETEMEGWLVDHIAERFMTLIGRESIALHRLLSEHDDLRESVFERLPMHKDARMRGEDRI
ncbi:hypothetical protein LTR37_014239 [Vermiconidia calcicola]|uniref:Uncharacterized protein n=1 Tax=Vermiconidia calcicola TaxID=1690605 RepID=A0ACC3MU66_9PEZI|nr:hypothetical protein LTR37_014239 [Vermiconidia calcicola]